MGYGFEIIDNLNKYRTPSTVGTVYGAPDLSPSFTMGTGESLVVKIITQKEEKAYHYNHADFADSKKIQFAIEEGENTIEYIYSDNLLVFKESFTIYGTRNYYPLKPWTVGDVLERIVQLVEPLRDGQKPRFSIAEPKEGKEKLFAQYAPEFTFTRQTFREALQTVGGFIHAEPRLRDFETGKYDIDFDYYGEQEYATYKNHKTNKTIRLSNYKYRTLQSNYGIEQAATRLDSYQDNLVNRLAWEQATTGQPYKGGVQTLRTETAYIRAEEVDSFFFPSTHGIDRVVKFEYINNGTAYDITPYVFEQNVYNNLSSYDESYPVSKSYALYYSQGGEGIKGFFYKVSSEWGGNVGKEYSIVNIIKAAAGISISGNYQDMQFRLTYVPIFSTRVQQSKAYLNDYLPLPRILNYTQSDNSVESRFFGENIKGAISRMGNVEKTYTLNLRNFNNIPKAGQLWDDEYYIASVSVSVNADLFEVSVGLSKNFNRKSQYIGTSSYRRIYEVSETMVQERHTVYTDYIVISEVGTELDNAGAFLGQKGIEAIARIFQAPKTDDSGNPNEPDVSVKAVHAVGATKSKALRKNILLPVISSAFGNAMEFTWGYKDNFSAGLQMQDKSSGSVTGHFGVEVDYADYYGRLYYYNFALLNDELLGSGVYASAINAKKLPELLVSPNNDMDSSLCGVSNQPLVERKDSRESIKKSYIVEFVTDDNSFVIGSALASLNPLVTHNVRRKQPHLYVLPYRVNKFDTHVDFSKGYFDLGTVEPTVKEDFYGYLQFSMKGKRFQNAGQSWVYAIPEYDGETYTVEDEDGNVTTVTPKMGGEMLLARNVEITFGDTVGEFIGYLVHDVFNTQQQ